MVRTGWQCGPVDDLPTGADVVAAWNDLAPFWDERSGAEGGDNHRLLLSPALHRLLDLQPGERALDVGCGNGVFSRELHARGAQVTAVDASEVFIDLARSRSPGLPIEWAVVDACDEEALAALGETSFDAVTACMVLMDLPEIAPLCHATTRLLRAGGRFVFAVLHPCFNNPSTSWVIEETRDLQRTHSLKVSRYRDEVAVYRAAGEPAPHWFFHRTLTTIVSELADAELVIDAVAEPTFDPDAATTSLWREWDGLPPMLIVRARPRA